jgi:hypothetical protein
VGDRISASLTRTTERWVVTLKDGTARHATTFATTQEATANTDVASWTQEDPRASGGRFANYPELEPVAFRGLLVNGRPPTSAQLVSKWMTLPGYYLAPTVPTGDSFGLRRARILPAGQRYLSAARAVDETLVAILRIRPGTAAAADIRPTTAALGQSIERPA